MFVYAHTDIVLIKMVLSITLQQTYTLAMFLNTFGVAREQKEHESKGEPNNHAGLLPVQKWYWEANIWKKAHKDFLNRDVSPLVIQVFTTPSEPKKSIPYTTVQCNPTCSLLFLQTKNTLLQQEHI